MIVKQDSLCGLSFIVTTILYNQFMLAQYFIYNRKVSHGNQQAVNKCVQAKVGNTKSDSLIFFFFLK